MLGFPKRVWKFADVPRNADAATGIWNKLYFHIQIPDEAAQVSPAELGLSYFLLFGGPCIIRLCSPLVYFIFSSTIWYKRSCEHPGIPET